MVAVDGKTDSELLAKSIEGNPSAFIALVHRYEGPLAGLIRRWVLDSHHAEDILQETLLQAWRSLRQLKEPDHLKAWLIQIARNRCRDYYKSSQRRHKPAEVKEIEIYVNRRGRAVTSRQDRVEAVEVAVKNLTARERKVLEMFYLEGLTIREISSRIRRPQGTIKQRLFKARQDIRHKLGVAPNSKEKAHE